MSNEGDSKTNSGYKLPPPLKERQSARERPPPPLPPPPRRLRPDSGYFSEMTPTPTVQASFFVPDDLELDDEGRCCTDAVDTTTTSDQQQVILQSDTSHTDCTVMQQQQQEQQRRVSVQTQTSIEQQDMMVILHLNAQQNAQSK